ncbi:hypothetical protein E8E11_011881 [Didymella keratinophila]|nr:hypothetical protein E8E11_011881 [Didymella keratinophila]
MRRRPSIQIDVEYANSAPACWPTDGRTHTAYTDLVGTLRGRGEATDVLVHYQETGKSKGEDLGVVHRKKDKQKLAEPRSREADPDDYSKIFEGNLSGAFGDMTMGVYVSEQNKLVQQVHASDADSTPFFKSVIERYP